MIKKIVISILYSFLTCYLVAQPTIQWQKSLGGSNYEFANDIQQTTDGGYIVCGTSTSSDGDVSVNKGNQDCWVVKLDVNGAIEWEKSYGGSLHETAESIIQTMDGGYIVSGSAMSGDGDVTLVKGLSDSWIIKIDNLGNIEWQKTYGGTAAENARKIIQLNDGKYVFVGGSGSTDGDITGHHGPANFFDIWVVKIDTNGALIWEKSYGGTSDEDAFSIEYHPNSSYLIAGYTRSINGDVTNNFGGQDYWLLNIDSIGNILWQKNYGGSGDDIAKSAVSTINGGFIVGGVSNSIDGDVTNNIGGNDFWIIKIDSIGIMQWEKNYGGSNHDEARSISVLINNNYVVFGETRSSDGDVTNNKGGDDYWLVKIDGLGNLLWEKTMGGSSFDDGNALYKTTDNSFIVAGGNASNDGDITGYKGAGDFWVVKLNPLVNINELEYGNDDIFVYPNPNNGVFNIDTKLAIEKIEIYNFLGDKIKEQLITKNNVVINMQAYNKGTYFIKVITSNQVITKKIIYL